MGVLYGFAVEDTSTETACKRIACTYGISHLHLRCVLERGQTIVSKHIRAIGATGQYEHLQMVVLYDLLTGLAHIQTIIAEHPIHDYQLLIVNLQDVTDAERILKHFLTIELLTQVDVTNAQTVIRCSVKELTDIITADDITLSQ